MGSERLALPYSVLETERIAATLRTLARKWGEKDLNPRQVGLEPTALTELSYRPSKAKVVTNKTRKANATTIEGLCYAYFRITLDGI